PVSTYTDSYRPPCSVKKTIQKQTLQQLCSENKFVTPGLTMPLVQNPVSQGQTEQLVKAAMQEYYRNTFDPAACCPEKYYLTRSEEKYKPVFVNKNRYISWRTGPYNSTVWNKYHSCLPILPKDTRMDTFLRSVPVSYPLKLACLNQCGNYLHPLPALQLYLCLCHAGIHPSHYCLRGMDYYVDGASAIRGQLNTLEDRAEYPMLQLQPEGNVLCVYTPPPVLLPVQEP
ncbi:Spermatid-specific manchette-related protein 1, partial [Tyto alba]